jgi:hypothetical protein
MIAVFQPAVAAGQPALLETAMLVMPWFWAR